jgi:hypothetical protein
VLLDRINESKYPSGQLMDRVEILLDRDHVDEYAGILFEKVEQDRFPSLQLLDPNRQVDAGRVVTSTPPTALRADLPARRRAAQ